MNSRNFEKAAFRVSPEVAILEKGMACGFEVFETPLFTYTLEDELSVLTKKNEKVITKRVGLNFKTELTTKLHCDDIVCEKEIGEGSFGVVYKGKFAGNDVAVKRMKEVDATEESMEEFEKEVTMLDKFRCYFIVHLNRACLIPNQGMVVTEFAPCGSLMDCIKKRPEQTEKIKAKLMLDAARGLAYLHANVVMHRDIKPDNVLVFALNEELTVNGKLTDFGSNRNVHMLMTNVTFTKVVFASVVATGVKQPR